MDKTLGLNGGKSGFQIRGRGKSSVRTLAVDARVKYLLTFITRVIAWSQRVY